MPSPQVSVHLIRAFSGPRHSTLEFLWDCFAEHCSDEFRLSVLNNPEGRSHAACLKTIWEAALALPERYVCICEFDFLPKFGKFLPLDFLSAQQPVLCAQYCTRVPGTNKLVAYEKPGAWYILADKHYVGDATKPLDFSPSGAHNDPANGMAAALERDYGRTVRYLVQQDAMPRHYGTGMFTGEHLFWSRHYNDDPETHIGGFHVGDILRRHDSAVDEWCAAAPRSFKALIKRRLCPKLA